MSPLVFMKNYLFKNLAKLVTKKIVAWLISKVGFLAWGPLKAVIGFFVAKLVEKGLELTFLGAMIGYIWLDVTRDLNAVEKIIKEIQKPNKELTDGEIIEFDKRLAKAGRELIRFGTIS